VLLRCLTKPEAERVKPNCAIVAFSIIIALSAPGRIGVAQTNQVPQDFELFAQYSAGYSPWKSWRLTISADGSALQEAYAFRGGNPTRETNYFHLAKTDLKQLATRLDDERFESLAHRYSPKDKITDNPTLVLRAMMLGKSNEVSVYAPDHLRGKAEVGRFLKVWNEVLRKVPSPNPEQKPE